MKSFTKVALLAIGLVAFLSIFSISLADEIVPFADIVFDTASVSLTTTKEADFQANTAEEKKVIKVTSVVLQKRSTSGTFIDSKTLTSPSDVWENGLFYDATKDYSDYIGSGTFRLKVKFYADGYTINRYSNARTY